MMSFQTLVPLAGAGEAAAMAKELATPRAETDDTGPADRARTWRRGTGKRVLAGPAAAPAAGAAIGWAALLAVWFLWGSTYDVIRIGVRDFPPFLLAGFRYLLAGAVILPLRARSIRAQSIRAERPFGWRNWRSAVIIGGLLLLGGNGLLTAGERRLPAGIAALLVATVPLWLVVFDAAAHRRMAAPRVIAGLALGVAGVVILVRPAPAHRLDSAAVATVLVASAAWALGSLYSKKAPQPREPFTGTAMQMIAGGALLIAAATATGEWGQLGRSAGTWQAVAALLWLALPCSVIAFSAYIYALKVLPTSTVATYAFVNPVVAALIGWPLLGEPVTAQIAIAGAVIVAAVVVILSADRKRKAQAGHKPAAG
jgi:drug/metabolite transporter (DMT)-like permease